MNLYECSILDILMHLYDYVNNHILVFISMQKLGEKILRLACNLTSLLLTCISLKVFTMNVNCPYVIILFYLINQILLLKKDIFKLIYL